MHHNLAKYVKTDFDQHLESAAPKCWSKYTTKIDLKLHNKEMHIWKLNLNFFILR